MTGVIICSFFPGLDENQFMYYREGDKRLASPLTIVENLDPIQFLMPYQYGQDVDLKKVTEAGKDKLLEMVNEVLNLASVKLKEYAQNPALKDNNDEIFEDFDQDIIQPLYILLVEDILFAMHGHKLNTIKLSLMHFDLLKDALLLQQITDISLEIGDIIRALTEEDEIMN